MNSHERRICERAWPYSVYIHAGGGLINDCFEWLNTNYGSNRMNRRRSPRWCYRPDMGQGPNFVIMQHGVSIFFRKEKDYAWFMLKWEQ